MDLAARAEGWKIRNLLYKKHLRWIEPKDLPDWQLINGVRTKIQ